MTAKTCPACGEAIESRTVRCPFCQLDGLNQIFLSHGDYNIWKKTVLEPHINRLRRRLFAGDGSLLILTKAGELYGMGSNYCGQIQENGPDSITEPVWMASDVVSAGVDSDYSIFATRDGRIHIRGRGEFAERVPDFSDAEEVFVSDAAFCVVNSQGTVLGFGENLPDRSYVGGPFGPRTQRELAQFPAYTISKGPFYSRRVGYYGSWDTNHPSMSDREDAEREIRSQVTQTEKYREFASRYGEKNLYISLNMTSRDTEHNTDGEWWVHYQSTPTLLLENNVIYTPTAYHDQDFANTPHRSGSWPMHASLRCPLDAYPQIRKACIRFNFGKDHYLAVCHDDTLVWLDPKGVLHPLDWPNAPVYDLAILYHSGSFIVSCRNGRLYEVDTGALPSVRIIREIVIK